MSAGDRAAIITVLLQPTGHIPQQTTSQYYQQLQTTANYFLALGWPNMLQQNEIKHVKTF